MVAKVGPCPACGQTVARCLGELPSTDFFAGAYHEHPFPGGQLLRCEHCGLGFRHPRLSEARLLDLYRVVSAEHWSIPTHERNDFAAIRQELSGYAKGGRVLDVGCHTGALLESLPDGWDKFGIEPNTGAAQIAARRGVRILGREVDCLQAHPGSFDVITAVDVLEHVYRPFDFLSALAGSLRAGGILLVSTGNMDWVTWRVMGAGYHYCSLAEHVTFLSHRWCVWAAGRLGMRLRSWASYSHHQAARPARQMAYDVCANLTFRFAPGAFRLVAGWTRPEGRKHIPPSWTTARDHFLCVLEKSRDAQPRAAPISHPGIAERTGARVRA